VKHCHLKFGLFCSQARLFQASERRSTLLQDTVESLQIELRALHAQRSGSRPSLPSPALAAEPSSPSSLDAPTPPSRFLSWAQESGSLDLGTCACQWMDAATQTVDLSEASPPIGCVLPERPSRSRWQDVIGALAMPTHIVGAARPALRWLRGARTVSPVSWQRCCDGVARLPAAVAGLWPSWGSLPAPEAPVDGTWILLALASLAARRLPWCMDAP
jgi:hypothetical protein